jgi:hypothetical protein
MVISASMLVTRFRVSFLQFKWLLTLLIATKTLFNQCVTGLNGPAQLPHGMMTAHLVAVKPLQSINGTRSHQVTKLVSGTLKEVITIKLLQSAINSQSTSLPISFQC